MYLAGGTHHNTIGGSSSAEGNVISGNSYHGIYLFGPDVDNNTIAYNRIGTDPSGLLALGNVREGIEVYGDCDGNTIGPANLIAFNSRNGVYIDGASASGDKITQNSIHSNGMAGIDLANGANQNISPPVIVDVTINSNVQIDGSACSGCTVEVFQSPTNDGEGRVWLGSAFADGGGNFSLVVPSVSQPYLTATATDAVKGTSEFSSVYTSDLLVKVYLPLAVR
jgi:parallel beta-helix repeat protein